MAPFRRRTKLVPIELMSPVSAEILHADPDAQLPSSERAAKRRRIEDNAKQCLQGKKLFIASANLKGPFDKPWVNPWAKKRSRDEIEKRENLHVPGEEAAFTPAMVARRPKPSSVLASARPMSRASPSSEYCHNWLRRQQLRPGTPDLEDDVDIDITATPTKAGRRHVHVDAVSPGPSIPNTRLPDVVPAWTADPHRVEGRRLRTDSSSNYPVIDSVQVDFGSSVGNRPHYRISTHLPTISGRQKDPIGDTTILTKISQIDEDKSMSKKHLPKRLRAAYKDSDSPGFVFRRLADGKRPGSRGSNLSNGTSTIVDAQERPLVVEEAFIEPMDHVEPEDDAHVMEAVDPSPENAAELESDASSPVALVAADGDGKWPCPVQRCFNRPNPYASRSGLSRHLRSLHDIHHTKLDVARTTTAKPGMKKAARKAKETTKKASSDCEVRSDEGNIESGIEGVTADSTMAGLPEKAGLGMPDSHSGEMQIVDAEQDRLDPHQAGLNLSPATWTEDIVHQNVAEIPVPISTEITPDDNLEKQVTRDVLLQQEATESNETALVTSADTVSNLPNRQDSRAYSTFTFNAQEMSTQAALYQAHQAFQETQSPEKETRDEVGEPDQSTIMPLHSQYLTKSTPFRQPPPRRAFSQAPDSILRAIPASTQDLMNAAAGLTFSTAKKPKKRASFADWPVAKASQITSTQLKAVDWSPSEENPFPAKAVSFNSADKTLTPMHPRSILSFSRIADRQVATFTSTPLGVSDPFAVPKSSGQMTPSASSEGPPIPSYQERQHSRMASQELDDNLDDMVSFLGTFDVDKEIARNSFGKGKGAA